MNIDYVIERKLLKNIVFRDNVYITDIIRTSNDTFYAVVEQRDVGSIIRTKIFLSLKDLEDLITRKSSLFEAGDLLRIF